MAGVFQDQQLCEGERRDVGLAVAIEVGDHKNIASACGQGKWQRRLESAIPISGEDAYRVLVSLSRPSNDRNICFPVSIEICDLRLKSAEDGPVLRGVTEVAVSQP